MGGGMSELSGHSYRGQSAPPVNVKVAFVQSGELNLELIEVVGSENSAFRDMFGPGEEGFHHVGIFSEEPAAERARLERLGYPVASEFVSERGTITFLDARSALGHMIELYSDDPIFPHVFEVTRAAAESWDGRNLFQSLN
ncbi:MAG: hypothetical protein EOP83_31285 [Verrucomicrobiaceae bacterium]|nr:MAG: hypothetical protein EOP83_31285 [Verrucomicrobiaceae bacterium]